MKADFKKRVQDLIDKTNSVPGNGKNSDNSLYDCISEFQNICKEYCKIRGLDFHNEYRFKVEFAADRIGKNRNLDTKVAITSNLSAMIN
jgi:hypothetical protein